MTKYFYVIIILICPIYLFGQNIGVGIESPVAKLHLKSSYSDPLIPGGTSNGILRISGQLTGDALDIGKIGSGTFDAWFQAGFAGGADPISFQPLGGNVGIGLLSPSAKLEVEGGIKADSMDVQSGVIKNVADPISAQDAATKAYVDLLESTVVLLASELEALQGVKDIDNNRYDIVTIGTQIWMAENLKTTRYNDGTVIPLITDSGDWSTASTNGDDAYCWYNNDASNLITYGALYNWYAIDMSSNGNKNVCPSNWHIPTNAELEILRDFLDPNGNGNANIAGGKMKEAGLVHWDSPNTSGTNESGFAGLPGGYRFHDGSDNAIGLYGYWWSSTESNATFVWPHRLDFNNAAVSTNHGFKGSGLSVRCLKD
jgi:uncharacterized protein (TIGR02145 family)